MQTSGLDHIVLNVSDLDRAQQFYGDLLGFDVKRLRGDFPGVFAGACYFMVGSVEIFILSHPQIPAGDRFSEFRIGLDHLSFVAPNEQALHDLTAKLRAAGVHTNGIEVFAPNGKKYVSFRDPDNIQLEYWLNEG
jgi:catechol 2,3-dioxygenase-like lactoylglutathione lyase family enzyme